LTPLLIYFVCANSIYLQAKYAIDFEIAKAKSANILEMKAAEKENKKVKEMASMG